MKSPITGKEMILHREERILTFRKEELPVVYHYYLCEDTGEQFTTTELDEIDLRQLYNQYRAIHHLPFPEEIKAVRKKYVLSATKMSEILGFGVNSYRKYEQGEVPNHSNGKLIRLANDPEKFKGLVELSESLDEEKRSKLLKKIDSLIEENEHNHFKIEMENYLLQNKLPDEFSGYRKPDLDRLTEMVVYFTEKLQPWKTQLNKFLFYADFLLFKNTCQSMSGTRYRAVQMGPVPSNYSSIYEYLGNNDVLDIYVTYFDNGGIGEQFKPRPDRSFNSSLFSEEELNILDQVVNRFKGKKTDEVIDLSHRELAWMRNQEDKELINYKYAFYLL